MDQNEVMKQNGDQNEAMIFAQEAAARDLVETEKWLKGQCLYSEVELFYRLGFPYIFCGEDEMGALKTHDIQQIEKLPSTSVDVLPGCSEPKKKPDRNQPEYWGLNGEGLWPGWNRRRLAQRDEVCKVATLEEFLAIAILSGKVGSDRAVLSARLPDIMRNQDRKYRIWQVILAPQAMMLKVVQKLDDASGRGEASELLNQTSEGRRAEELAPALGYVTIEIPETVEVALRLVVWPGSARQCPMRNMIYSRQFRMSSGWSTSLSEWRLGRGIQVYKHYPDCKELLVSELLGDD